MEVLLAATIVFCAASVQGAIGFGAGLIAIAFLPLFWEVPYVVAVLSPVSVVLTGSLVFQLRKHVEFGDVRGLLWPMPLGVGVGLWALSHWSEFGLRACLGLLLLSYVLFSGYLRNNPGTVSIIWGYLAGFLGGFCGGALSSAGPPILVYAATCGWEKNRFRANLQFFFVFTSVFGLVGLLYLGLVTWETGILSLGLIPFVVGGAWVGDRVAAHLNEQRFRRMVLWALGGMGLFYLARAFWG